MNAPRFEDLAPGHERRPYDQTPARAERWASRKARGELAVVESPYLGGPPWALLYARLALREQLDLGRIPFASHLLYPQALNDAKPEQRKLGIEAGWIPYAMGAIAAVYVDFGITLGMQEGIEEAKRLGCKLEARAFGTAHREVVLRAAGGAPYPYGPELAAQSTVIEWPGGL